MINLTREKPHGARPYDYIYDPNCIFSHPRDHQRAEIKSFHRVAECQICPNFLEMFSELKNYPSENIKVKHPDRAPSCVDRSWYSKIAKKSATPLVDIEGTHHCLFYKRPVLPNNASEPCIVEKKDTRESSSAADENMEPESVESNLFSRTCGTQTIYRESESQTIPFTPPVTLWDHENFHHPEIFHLLHLKWGKGLPVGLKEVEDIEWEKNHRSLKSCLNDPLQYPKKQYSALLEYVHKEKWIHREKEIQEIHNLRMQLAEKLMVKRECQLSERAEDMINRKYEKKLNEKNQKLKKIRNDHKRAIRKLVNKHKGISTKYNRPDPITELSDYSSELYVPLMRHGVDPRHRHEMPLGIRSKFLHDYKGLQVLEKTERWLSAPKVAIIKERSNKSLLCPRAFPWSEDQLLRFQKHFEDSASKRNEKKSRKIPACVKCIYNPKVRPLTPTLDGVPENKDTLYQAVSFMQKIIIGRAIQILMFKGREKYQGLLEELCPALKEEEEIFLKAKEIKVKEKYQNWMDKKELEEIFERIQSKYVEETSGDMLDFLSKEMERLDDERSIHALLLLAERHHWEARQVGQAEEGYRNQNDNLSQQKVIQGYQDSSDLNLEVLKSLDWVATPESRDLVRELARDIGHKTRDMEERNKYWTKKKLTADLVLDLMTVGRLKDLQQEDSNWLQERSKSSSDDQLDRYLEICVQSGGNGEKDEKSQMSVTESNDEIIEVADSKTSSNPEESSDSGNS